MSGPRFFSKWETLWSPAASSLETLLDGKNNAQYIIVTSHWSGNLSLYSVTKDGIVHIWSLPVPRAMSTKAIYINERVYLAVACTSNDNNNDDGTHSRLYLWEDATNDNDGPTLKLVQTFKDVKANDVSYGTTNKQEILLTFTTQGGRHSLGTTVYKWSPSRRLFESIQTLNTTGGGGRLHFFYTKDDLLLSIACQYNAESFVYKWNGSHFEVFQTIPSSRTTDLYPMFLGSHLHLIAANFYGPLVVYKMSRMTGRFERFQTIGTSRTVMVDAFTINSEYFMAVANAWNSTALTSNATSAVYKFNGASFSMFQEIPTFHVAAINVFPTLFGCRIMGIINLVTRTVDIYKWEDTARNSVCDY